MNVINSEPYKEFILKQNKAIETINNQINKAYSEEMLTVLIYQMGKVGSTSYSFSLQSLPNITAFHVHRMLPTSNFQMINNFIHKKRVDLAIKERQWMELYDKIILENRPVYIISAVREPISRNISAFFENKSFFFKDDEGLTNIIKKFMKNYNHNIPFSWYNEQIKKALNIDIFDFAFDKEKGYQVINKNNIKLLLMTSEMEDIEKEKAIMNFLNLQNFSIQARNISSQKEYANTYKKFKEKIIFPEKFVNSMLENEFIYYFYTDKMIDKFKHKWSK